MVDFCEKNGFFEENKRFSGVIRKYASRLRDPHADGELWGFLWLLQNSPKKPPNDFYIFACLKHEYIRLSKGEGGRYETIFPPLLDNCKSLDFWLDFKEIFTKFTPKQQRALCLKMQGFSTEEIAKIDGISRQAEHRKIARARSVFKKNLDFCF
jgi:hypothetical protein